MLYLLKKIGVKLPPREDNLDGLTVETLIGKIRDFYARFEKIENADNELLPLDFFELLSEYPVSMCGYNMNDTVKLLIALYYFHDRTGNPKENDFALSYEDLTIIFDRSKSSIHDAIKQKEAEAKRLLEEAKLRSKAKEIALQELIQEEKEKLLKQKQQIEQTNAILSTE
ncbi:MAG: hypothetical protein QXM86_04115 [Candidatus Bathyarchaeia archaeon]